MTPDRSGRAVSLPNPTIECVRQGSGCSPTQHMSYSVTVMASCWVFTVSTVPRLYHPPLLRYLTSTALCHPAPCSERPRPPSELGPTTLQSGSEASTGASTFGKATGGRTPTLGPLVIERSEIDRVEMVRKRLSQDRSAALEATRSDPAFRPLSVRRDEAERWNNLRKNAEMEVQTSIDALREEQASSIGGNWSAAELAEGAMTTHIRVRPSTAAKYDLEIRHWAEYLEAHEYGNDMFLRRLEGKDSLKVMILVMFIRAMIMTPRDPKPVTATLRKWFADYDQPTE